MWKPPYKTKMIGYRSKITGNFYSSDEYTNHGYGGIKVVETKLGLKEYKDLPQDEYPYSVEYEDLELSKPKWLK